MQRINREFVEKGLQVHREFQDMVSAKKYQHQDEVLFEEVIDRVKSIFRESVDARLLTYAQSVEDLLDSGKFIPAGSILSGAGNTEYKCSLSNCYLSKIDNDSIESIFDALKKLARTYSYRGGSGIDITVLRPKGGPVNNAARTSSGAVSFMPLFSEVTNAIGQQGRRGALLISMDVRHPDILDFIWSKAAPEKVFGRDTLTDKVPDIFGANISVKLTDAFMNAAKNDDNWTSIFPDREADTKKYDTEWDGDYEKWVESGGVLKEYQTVPARDVLTAIAEASWLCGDPGCMFIDTVQRMAPGTAIDSNLLKPLGMNPCGEQALSYYGNCLLGAMVLPKYVSAPWDPEHCKFDIRQFKIDVQLSVLFMNTMSDINESLHPLIEQREADEYGKRIGIEFTGLADTLAMLGYEYDSQGARDFVEGILQEKAIAEIGMSCEIARMTSPCDALHTFPPRVRFLDCEYTKALDLPKDLRSEIHEHGLRNTAFNTVGPTGSISIMSGNCTSGMEPMFMFKYQRKTRLSDTPFDLIHQPALEYLATLTDEELAKIDMRDLKDQLKYMEAHEIAWKDRLLMQQSIQKYTDASISSTLNMPENATVAQIMEIITTAHGLDLKGLTIFRNGCKKGVLSAVPDPTPLPLPTPASAQTQPVLFIKELLDVEKAERHRVLWKGAKMYVIISLDDDDQPVEVFVKLPREAGINGGGHYSEVVFQEKFSLWEAVTRLTSLLLRAGMPLDKIIKQLDKSSYSLVDASAVLARLLRKYQDDPDIGEYTDEEIVEQNLGVECKECHAFAYVFEGGCGVCKACGYTNCG